MNWVALTNENKTKQRIKRTPEMISSDTRQVDRRRKKEVKADLIDDESLTGLP